MTDKSKLADLPADVSVSRPERLAEAYRDYERYHVTIKGTDGAPVEEQRDILRGGKVAAVLPVDLARDEIVLLRQFRMAAHLANGHGDLIEIVAGRVEAGEQPAVAARRECAEEIGVSPAKIVELFTYLPTPGIADEEVTLYLGVVDASEVQEGAVATVDSEQLYLMRVPIDAALAALNSGALRNGPLLIALQWLALNRDRLPALLL
jgi:ADP-ribose pyrophosphatase